MIELLQKLIETDALATQRVRETLRGTDTAAIELLSHILASKRVWLARIEGRDTAGMSPFDEWNLGECEAIAGEVDAGWRSYLSKLRDPDLGRSFTYTNKQGQSFTSSIGDILLQVAVHGAHHRGQINKLIRDAGGTPPLVDYIVFNRTVGAAPAAG